MLSQLEDAAEDLPIYEGLMPYGGSAYTEAGRLAMEQWEKESCAIRVDVGDAWEFYWVTKISPKEYYVFLDTGTNDLPGRDHHMVKYLWVFFGEIEIVELLKRDACVYSRVEAKVWNEEPDSPQSSDAASSQSQTKPSEAASSI